MANKHVKMYGTTMPTTNTTVYSAPTNSYAVLKQLIFTNWGAIPATVQVSINGIWIIYGKKVNPDETVYFDIAPLIQYGNTITCYATTANVNMLAHGLEVGMIPAARFVGGIVPATSTAVWASGGKQRKISEIILCNTSSVSTVTVSVQIDGVSPLVYKYPLKPNETLRLGTFVILSAGQTITMSASVADTVDFHFTVMEVS